MKLAFYLVFPVLLLLAWVGEAAAGSDEKIKQVARGVLAKYENAVVCVKIVGGSYFIVDAKPSPKTDFKAEVAGTILTANGLTAMCNYSTDFENILPSIVAVGGDAAPQNKQIYEITEIKLGLKDGREIPAELVMRDAKLGVAFVAPKERGLKLTHVALDKGPIPEVLDEVIFLNRLGTPLKRGSEVGIVPISAVLKQPQMLLVPVSEGGYAAFDASGRPLGVTVVRSVRENRGVPIEGLMMAVVLTAETLRPAMDQALKKWEEKGK